MAKKILIIDDEEQIVTMLDSALTDLGYEVYHTTEALRALDAIREHEPDIVLLDMMMPYLDGTDELQLMKLTQKNTPVVIITAHPEVRDHEEEYHKLGVREILMKPFGMNDLLKTIETILG